MLARILTPSALLAASLVSGQELSCTFDDYIAKPVETDGAFTFKFTCNKAISGVKISGGGFYNASTTWSEADVDATKVYSLIEWVDTRFEFQPPGMYMQTVELYGESTDPKFTFYPKIDVCNQLECYDYKPKTYMLSPYISNDEFVPVYVGEQFNSTVFAEFGVTQDEFAWNPLPITIHCADAIVKNTDGPVPLGTLEGAEACQYVESRMTGVEYPDQTGMKVQQSFYYTPAAEDVGTYMSACFTFTDNQGAYVAQYKKETNGVLVATNGRTACINLQDAAATTTANPGGAFQSGLSILAIGSIAIAKSMF